MWQTLFHIPHELFGIPVFGVGWALGLLVVGSSVHLTLQARRRAVDREVWGFLPVMVVIGAAIVFVLPGCEEMVDGERAGIAIRGYGVMMLVAIIAGVALAAYRARRMGLDPEIIYSLAFYMFVLGILGARLFFIIEYRNQVFRDTWGETFWAMFDVTQGGLVVWWDLLEEPGDVARGQGGIPDRQLVEQTAVVIAGELGALRRATVAQRVSERDHLLDVQ